MADLTFEEVLEAAERLSADERAALVERLRVSLVAHNESDMPPTRADALTALERLRATGTRGEDLFGAFASTHPDISEAELERFLNDVQTAWKKEWEDSFDDKH